MDKLNIRIIPSNIPLGSTIEASLVLLYTGVQALETLRARLRVPSALRLLGLDTLNILRVPAGEEVVIPIRITGDQPGLMQIRFSQLNARTAAGAVLNFDDRDLEVEVSNSLELNPGDVSLMLEPSAPLIQNRIGRVICRLHNNGIFSLSAPEITISAHGVEVYRGTQQASRKSLAPGSSFEMDEQVLPMVAGMIRFSIQTRFLIKEQAFIQEEMRVLDVRPSRQRISTQSVAASPPKDTKTILLVSASPQDQAILRSDKEIKNILFEMKHSAPLREHFQVEVLPAATMDDLSREVIYLRPYLIHFSGHGSEQGILLENEDEAAKLVPTAALLALLKPLSGQVMCVILNACETLDSARELAQCIPYVIGMRQEILDPAAIAFSKGFYEAVGAGHPIEPSFELGRARLLPDYYEENQNPVLFNQGTAM